MTTLRRYLDAAKIAVAAFWHLSRPPQDDLEIIEETPAETIPRAIPGDDALALPPGFVPEEDLGVAGVDPIGSYEGLTEQPDLHPVFYLMSFSQAADGELTWGSSTELTVPDIVQMTGEDVDTFLAQPAVVQDKFCGNLLAGLPPAEALVIAQVSPAVMN